jgi:lactoylglutathione lyase
MQEVARIVGVHHAGVYVQNLERSIAFYTDAFGLQLAERFDFDGEKLAFLLVGGARLELIEPTQRSLGVERSTSGVVDHVALQVQHLDALLDRLRERGVVLLDSAPVDVPPLGARIVFCLGPDGERIELVEQYVRR